MSSAARYGDVVTDVLAEPAARVDEAVAAGVAPERLVLDPGLGFAKTAGDYLRIDGPGVWIEFLCRTGTADTDELAYQSVYRDHNRDYGGLFTF